MTMVLLSRTTTMIPTFFFRVMASLRFPLTTLLFLIFQADSPLVPLDDVSSLGREERVSPRLQRSFELHRSPSLKGFANDEQNA